MENIKLPMNSIKYIIFQRTGYLRENAVFRFLTFFGSHFSYWLLVSNSPFYKISIALKSLLFFPQIKRAFNKDMEYEFSIIKKYLPREANAILDIGCGVAGIDVPISHHYQNKVDIFLIDKTHIDKNVYYNFKDTGSFYNSLDVAKKILEINGVDSDKIHFQEATADNKIKFNQTFDVVISLLSWGFHYPVSTYLNEVYNKLNKNGILIVDMRRDTDGEKEIEKKFGNCNIILDGKKFIKILAKKQ